MGCESQNNCPAFSECLAKFQDEFGNPTTITTTSPAPTTKDTFPPIREDHSSGLLGGNLAAYVGAGSGGLVVFCLILILCVCRCRNAEKRKRQLIEADYRVVATTLTNVNDSDGTTYEELCIDNPHYNKHTDVQLPYKKDRKRLPGVSNTVTDTFKRWVSVDGNQPTASNKPLPPIPDPNRTRTLPNYSKPMKPMASQKLSKSIDEYTEAGVEVQRRSNVYNPLDMNRFGHVRDSHGTYESLADYPEPDDRTAPLEGLPEGEYFLLQKEEDEIDQLPSPTSGEYMTLAKEDDDTLDPEKQKLLPSAKKENNSKETKEPVPISIEEEIDSGIGEGAGHKNDYYIIDKNANTPDPTDYIEPVTGDTHSYMQVLPDTMSTKL